MNLGCIRIISPNIDAVYAKDLYIFHARFSAVKSQRVFKTVENPHQGDFSPQPFCYVKTFFCSNKFT